MRLRAGAIALLLLAGCKVKEKHYDDKYLEAFCTFAMACYAPAVLDFHGWSDVDECVSAHGPEWAADVEGCTYDKDKADQCLKEFKQLDKDAKSDPPICPAGDPTEPAVCAQAYDCGGGNDTDGGGDTP